MAEALSIDCDLSQLLDECDLRSLFRQYGSEMSDRIRLLQQASRTSNFSQTRRLSHQLKGSALQYGFKTLGSYAGSLERLAEQGAPFCELNLQTDTVINECLLVQKYISELLECNRS